MESNENDSDARIPRPRHLTPVPGTRRPQTRDAAVARVRDARRAVLPRHERFAHLKRMYD